MYNAQFKQMNLRSQGTDKIKTLLLLMNACSSDDLYYPRYAARSILGH
jgi:hypothetical protein